MYQSHSDPEEEDKDTSHIAEESSHSSNSDYDESQSGSKALFAGRPRPTQIQGATKQESTTEGFKQLHMLFLLRKGASRPRLHSAASRYPEDEAQVQSTESAGKGTSLQIFLCHD